MINFSLSSHLKKLRLPFLVVASLLVFVLLASAALSFLLNKKLADTKEMLSHRYGVVLAYRYAYVNLLQGVSVGGIVIKGKEGVYLKAERVRLAFEPLVFLRKKISLKEINVDGGWFDPELSSGLVSFLQQNFRESPGFLILPETTYFKFRNFQVGPHLNFDGNGYLSSVRDKLLISRGTLLLKHIHLSALPDVDILEGSAFYEPFDYVFEGELGDDRFSVSRFELSNSSLSFSGNGTVRELSKLADTEFVMDFRNITLEELPALNNEEMRSRGLIEAQLTITGPIRSAEMVLKSRMTSCSFTFFDSFYLTDLEGVAVIESGKLQGEISSVKVNGLSFSADFTLFPRTVPHLTMSFSSLYRVGEMSALDFMIDADWAQGALTGEMKGGLRYAAHDAITTSTFDLEGFRLELQEDAALKARNLAINIHIDSLEKKTILEKNLALSSLACSITRQPQGFLFRKVTASFYGGGLTGEAGLIPTNEKMSLKGILYATDVDLGDLFQPKEGVDRVFSGILNGSLAFDNNAKALYKGHFRGRGGTIAENPILNAVANFFGVDSLKRVSFNEILISLEGGRGDYTASVKLDSSKIRATLDGQITSHENVDGYLSVSIPSEVLRESKQFKRLLNYIKHDEPYVLFPFKITSYIGSPRILWLKNEFKEKLQNLLPEGNKRLIQRQVDGMIEGMGGK